MRVLAIESTCDETGACIGESFGAGVKIIAETKATSSEITSKYGGVVPEVVAREQVAAIIPVIKEAMEKGPSFAKASEGHSNIQGIDAVAVSFGPGLVGSLLIGIETAKALAWAWDKPLLKVNHMVGHVFSNWIVGGQELKESRTQVPELPAIGLVVSGGHTDLVLIKSLTDWQWIGGTRDDAAGEAFDKVARAMGLPYPGGPAVAKLAAEYSGIREQGSERIKLPRPMIHEDGLSMSFSGLKTAVIQEIDKGQLKMDKRDDQIILAHEFNNAVVEVLVNKTMKAVEAYQPKSVILAGGVAANQLLREQLEFSILNSKFSSKVFIPDLRYCTDNAAMIAAAAIMRPVETETLFLRPSPSLEVV